MAFSDLSFKFFTDSGLTTAFSNLYQLIHYTDLSDGNQDFTLYFGSAEATGERSLEATSNPGVDDIVLTPTDNLDDWAATTAYSLGARVEPTTPNTYVYECTTAGTSSGSEPTWPTTVGNTVSDGTVVWTCISNRHEITEIKLALTSGGLAGATPGAGLALGTTILSGSGNAVEVHIRVTNAVTDPNDNTGYPEITLNLNEVEETQV
jgi:hypothetical protein